MNSTRAIAFVASLVISISACATRSSAPATLPGASMTNVHAKPVSLMIAQKIERPLYIVLDR
jgi:hypothetical protein